MCWYELNKEYHLFYCPGKRAHGKKCAYYEDISFGELPPVVREFCSEHLGYTHGPYFGTHTEWKGIVFSCGPNISSRRKAIKQANQRMQDSPSIGSSVQPCLQENRHYNIAVQAQQPLAIELEASQRGTSESSGATRPLAPGSSSSSAGIQSIPACFDLDVRGGLSTRQRRCYAHAPPAVRSGAVILRPMPPHAVCAGCIAAREQGKFSCADLPGSHSISASSSSSTTMQAPQLPLREQPRATIKPPQQPPAATPCQPSIEWSFAVGEDVQVNIEGHWCMGRVLERDEGFWSLVDGKSCYRIQTIDRADWYCESEIQSSGMPYKKAKCSSHARVDPT